MPTYIDKLVNGGRESAAINSELEQLMDENKHRLELIAKLKEERLKTDHSIEVLQLKQQIATAENNAKSTKEVAGRLKFLYDIKDLIRQKEGEFNLKEIELKNRLEKVQSEEEKSILKIQYLGLLQERKAEKDRHTNQVKYLQEVNRLDKYSSQLSNQEQQIESKKTELKYAFNAMKLEYNSMMEQIKNAMNKMTILHESRKNDLSHRHQSINQTLKNAKQEYKTIAKGIEDSTEIRHLRYYDDKMRKLSREIDYCLEQETPNSYANEYVLEQEKLTSRMETYLSDDRWKSMLHIAHDWGRSGEWIEMSKEKEYQKHFNR